MVQNADRRIADIKQNLIKSAVLLVALDEFLQGFRISQGASGPSMVRMTSPRKILEGPLLKR